METLAPPVVAVVVAHDPGPWFEETLASIASQDYAELSVLVLDSSSGGDDLAVRVASVLPTAFVRRFESNRGFGATANEAVAMVDGASYFLLCHDDVALFPDTVHLLVEEAFRSNAGIVAPKVVSWDDTERLLHVGMAVDKGGSVVERVQPNEIDHGQHDAVRDVFVAPGGTTLVRADLFEELGGYDPAIVAMGEDLDLCWRAQVAGARIIVAPDARVRHLEEVASGSRAIGATLLADGPGRSRREPISLQELQRRHELLAVFKCYSLAHLLRVVPQLVVLALGEVVVAELAGNRPRVRSVLRAWRWNLGRLRVVRRQRAQLRARRCLGDKEIRVLQIGGSARLSAYGRRVFQHGFHGAHADELAAAGDPGEPVDAGRPVGIVPGSVAAGPVGAGPVHAGPVGAGPPAAVGAREALRAAGREDGPVVAGRRGRVSSQGRLVVWLAAALFLVIGTRGVLGGRLPAVGQFVPFPGLSSTWAQFVAGWHPSGVGTTAPASPALGLSALVGTVLLGGMGLTQKLMIFACVPLGVWGVLRLLRPFGSQRASVVAGLAYLAVALPYNALASGRWGALVVYAGGPWVLARLFRATGTEPFASPSHPAAASVGSSGPSRRATGGWRPRAATVSVRGGLVRNVLALGLLEAVLVSFVPAAAVVVVLSAIALVVSSGVYGDWRSTGPALGMAAGSTVVAAVLCLPWLIGVLAAGRGAVAVLGVPVTASAAAPWGSLLRFSTGPIGDSPLGWGFAVAALVPLIVGRGARFRWAGRFWSIALVFWVFAWVVGRRWTGGLAIDPLVLLGPAAVAIAACIGLGVAAFEEDLRAAEFGWRQLVTVVAAGAVVVGSLPTLVSALPGRWNLPINDFGQSVAWMPSDTPSGAFRVLWLGDARAINQGSWSAGGGLAYATSDDGAPDARWLWNGASPGPAAGLASAVDLARSDRTDQLGRMLAPAGVRYVVLLTSLAPEITGEQSPEQLPVAPDVAPALGRQLDLKPVVSGTGITVYANTDWIPVRAEVTPGTVVAGSDGVGSEGGGVPATATAAHDAAAVLPGPAASSSYRGPLRAGTVLSALAPAGRWTLLAPSGAPAARSPSFGWAASYRVHGSGTGVLRFDAGPLTVVAAIFSIAVWVLAVAALADRRRFGGRRLWTAGAPRRTGDGAS